MFCNKCGNQVEDGARFCPKCGVKFQTPGNGAMEKTVKKTGGNRGKIILILAVICIVMLVGIVAWLNRRDRVIVVDVVVDGIRYECCKDLSNEKTAIVLCPEKEVRGNLEIPETVRKGFRTYRVVFIGTNAFRDCDALESVKLPDSISAIWGNAFDGCSSLTSIDLPDSIVTIRSGAFSGCSSLTSIDLPNSIDHIMDGAFSGCSSLTSIDLPDSITYIGDYAFEGCSSLTSIDLPDKKIEISYSAFDGCSNLVLKVPETVASIPNEILKEIKGVDMGYGLIEYSEEENVGLEYSRSDFKSDRAYQEYSDFGDTSGLRK